MEPFQAPTSVGHSDLTLISVDGHSFEVHLLNFRAACNLIPDMLTASSATERDDKHITLQLSDERLETKAVLTTVLPFFYNMPTPCLVGLPLDLLTKVYSFGEKWDSVRIVETASAALISATSNASLPSADAYNIYIIACRTPDQSLKAAYEHHALLFIEHRPAKEILEDLGVKDGSELIDIWCRQTLVKLDQKERDRVSATMETTAAIQSAHQYKAGWLRLQVAVNNFFEKQPDYYTAGWPLPKAFRKRDQALRELASQQIN